jgi:hypothetical protein
MGKCRVELLDTHALEEDGRTWSEDRAVLDIFSRVPSKDGKVIARLYDLLLKPAESLVAFAVDEWHAHIENPQETVCFILGPRGLPARSPRHAMSDGI